MDSTNSDFARERRRILRAADEGRLQVNDSGRYVIVGEKKRPERKARESLMYAEYPFISWPTLFDPDNRKCCITVEGKDELRDLDAPLGASA